MSITLRFVSSSDIVSRIIRGGELGFLYQHVEARMPDGTLLGAHADGGVQARAADYDKTYIQDLYVTVPCQPDAVATFHDFLRSQIGKPYDMKAIAEMADGFVTGEAPSWPDSPSWICSALITAGLLTAEIIKAAPATVRLATPRDVLVACSALTIIGEPKRNPGVSTIRS
jgi:hypothetical protein